MVTGISGWKKLCFAPWDRGDIPQDPNRHGGTGLLSGGRPQRGHTVECSSSRVTYCYTVLSPVKSIYTHVGNTPLTSEQTVWTSEKTGSGAGRAKRLHNAHGCTLKLGYLGLACIWHLLEFSDFHFWRLQTVLLCLVKFCFTVWRVYAVKIYVAWKINISSWNGKLRFSHTCILCGQN